MLDAIEKASMESKEILLLGDYKIDESLHKHIL